MVNKLIVIKLAELSKKFNFILTVLDGIKLHQHGLILVILRNILSCSVLVEAKLLQIIIMEEVE